MEKEEKEELEKKKKKKCDVEALMEKVYKDFMDPSWKPKGALQTWENGEGCSGCQPRTT